MRPIQNRGAAAALLVFALGCAGASQTSTPSPSVSMQAGTGAVGPGLLQWRGNFRSTRQQSGSGTDVSGLNVASGSILMTAQDERNTRVQLTISGPAGQNAQLPWAVVPGPCRSGSIPLMPISSFPLLRMNDGRAELDQVVSFPLPTEGNYHINVYDGNGTDEADVMVCSELKLERRRN